jgi:hypothetical protein
MRRRKTDYTPIIILAVLGSMFLATVAGIIVILVVANSSTQPTDGPVQVGNANARPAFVTPIPIPVPIRSLNPTASSEGMTWTLKELGEYFVSKRVISIYELPPKDQETVFGNVFSQPMLAKIADGRIVEIRRHNGTISAEQYARSDAFDPKNTGFAYSWGVFSLVNKTNHDDANYQLAAVLSGAVRHGR